MAATGRATARYRAAARRRRSGAAASFSRASVANLERWYDAADPATLFQDSGLTTPAAADANPVGGWKDKSGNGAHAIQATAGLRPLLKTGLYNGNPGVRFDGVDDLLAFAALALTGLTFIGVVKLTAAGPILAPSAGSGPLLYQNQTLEKDGAASIGTSTTGLSTSQQNQFTVTYDGTNYLFRKNGSANGSGANAQAFGGSLDTLGNDAAHAHGVFNGDVCEILVYSRALVAPEYGVVESYLKAKWGTP